jgi:hypothetical protein
MKTTARARHTNGTKRQSTQAKTSQRNGSDIFPDDYKTTIKIVSKDKKGRRMFPLTICELGLPQFARLKKIAEKSDSSLSDLLKRAFARALVEDDGIAELETLSCKINTLLQLLSDKFDHLRTGDDNEFSGKYASDYCTGINIMCMEAQRDLSKTVDKILHAAYGNSQEVAS